MSPSNQPPFGPDTQDVGGLGCPGFVFLFLFFFYYFLREEIYRKRGNRPSWVDLRAPGAYLTLRTMPNPSNPLNPIESTTCGNEGLAIALPQPCSSTAAGLQDLCRNPLHLKFCRICGKRKRGANTLRHFPCFECRVALHKETQALNRERAKRDLPQEELGSF